MKWISLASLIVMVVGGGVVSYYAADKQPPAADAATRITAPVTPAQPPVNVLGPKVIGGTYEDSGCVIVTLKPDGSYIAAETGQCGMPYWDAAGRWSATKTTLTLTPSTEHGMTRGRLRTLDIVDLGERLIFLRPSDRALFKQYGIKRVSCFQRQDQFVDNELISQFVRHHPDKQSRSEDQP
jgi:hypothetical protein